jgi:hypothetical protein
VPKLPLLEPLLLDPLELVELLPLLLDEPEEELLELEEELLVLEEVLLDPDEEPPELEEELDDELPPPPSPPQAASRSDKAVIVQPRASLIFMVTPGDFGAYSMVAVVATEEGEPSAATGAAIDVRAPPLPIRNPYRPADPAA